MSKRIHNLLLWSAALWMLCVASVCVATTRPYHNGEDFPAPMEVRQQVRFWEKVFGVYPSTTFVVHDANHPSRVVDLIDFTAYGKTAKGVLPRQKRQEIADRFVARYQLAVRRFKTHGRKALKFGAIEKRVFKVFGRNPVWLKELYRGDVSFRAQGGLADDFVNATAMAQAYFPFMESTFRAQGVPEKLTRLVFVESMFNKKALSKVGASGLWQFMPQTARNYVHVNRLVDERHSVPKATRAAARLLRDNYRILGTWPLAITAYNHGPQGLRRAMKKLGSKDIGRIISGYDSSSFGFASRNFYAEFLAAANVYDRLIKTGKAKSVARIPATRPLVLTQPTSVAHLVATTPLNDQLLKRHNPCLNPEAFTTLRRAALPKGYELYVPVHMAKAVDVALAARSKTYARR